MSQEELAKALEVVHRELSDTEELDPKAVEQLRATMSEIQEVLEAKDESSQVKDRVQDSAERFEDSHPELTRTLSNIVDILQRMGF